MKILSKNIVFVSVFLAVQTLYADFKPESLTCYLPLFSETSGIQQRQHLLTIHHQSKVKGESISVTEKDVSAEKLFKMISEKSKKIKGHEGGEVKIVAMNSVILGQSLNVDWKKVSLAEAIDKFCALTKSQWYLDSSAEGVTICIVEQGRNL